jgi:hypothetical protein
MNDLINMKYLVNKMTLTTLTVVIFNIKCKILIFVLSQESRPGRRRASRHPLATALHVCADDMLRKTLFPDRREIIERAAGKRASEKGFVSGLVKFVDQCDSRFK